MNPDIITNMAQNPVMGGPSVDLASPLGAFMIGFCIILIAWVFGWMARTVRWVGHSGPGME